MPDRSDRNFNFNPPFRRTKGPARAVTLTRAGARPGSAGSNQDENVTPGRLRPRGASPAPLSGIITAGGSAALPDQQFRLRAGPGRGHWRTGCWQAQVLQDCLDHSAFREERQDHSPTTAAVFGEYVLAEYPE